MDVVMNFFKCLTVNSGVGNRTANKMMSFLGLEIMAHLLLIEKYIDL